MKIAVLGAGVSGLTAAHKFLEVGIDVTVYEKCDKVGGLAKTRITHGYVYDAHGGHIFNSKNEDVVNWIFGLLPKDKWQFTVRNAKIFFNGRYVSYPFELSLCELSEADAVDCALDFILAQDGAEPDNYFDWLKWNFGDSISDKYMIPYNSKIWAYPLDKMETSWMKGKMPLPTKKEMLQSLLLKDSTERKMPHSTFYYPIEGGIQTMVDAIASGLNIKTNTAVEKLEEVNSRWFVNGEGPYDRVISTIPLPILDQVLTLPLEVSNSIQDLKYNSLTTALYKCPPTDISWLYIPSEEYLAHRIGYQSALTPKAAPYGGGSCALEVIGPRIDLDNEFIINNSVVPAELGLTEMIDFEFTLTLSLIHI